jgi:hypothetical protein
MRTVILKQGKLFIELENILSKIRIKSVIIAAPSDIVCPRIITAQPG